MVEELQKEKLSDVLQANVDYVAGNFLAGLTPPPEMTISQWAEENRILSGFARSTICQARLTRERLTLSKSWTSFHRKVRRRMSLS